MVGFGWFRGEAGAVEEERWIDQDKAREVLAATEHLAEGAGCDRRYTVIEDRGRVVILDDNEALVLSGCWVRREVYAQRMRVELANQILADARRQLRTRQGIEGWDITPAIRFAMAINVYVMQGARQAETVLCRRQFDAIWRSMEPELGPGHYQDCGPSYCEGLTIRQFWNRLTGLREPQPCFEMIDWDFKQPLSTRILVQLPEIPWLNPTAGLPQVLPTQRFDAYLAYTYGTKLEGIDLILDTTLTEMTRYAQRVQGTIGAMLYPAGECLTEVVKRYQLRSYPQFPKIYWVPTYTVNGVQPRPREVEVVRLMCSIYEEKENIDFEQQAQEQTGPIFYTFFPPHEYGLYWSFYYDIYPGGAQSSVKADNSFDDDVLEMRSTNPRSSSTELQVLADPNPVLEGGPFVPCLSEFMEHLGLVDCSIWVEDLLIYPYFFDQPPPKHLIGRVFDCFNLRELQGSLKIQLGTKILFHQCGDNLLVPPEAEIYQAIDRWHAIP